MDAAAQAHIDAFVDKYRAVAPSNWVRVVTWWACLADDRGVVDRSSMSHVELAIVLGADGLGSEYLFADSQASFDIDDLNEALAGEPEAGWNVLRVEIDRDGAVRTDFDAATVLPMEGSATNPFWDDLRQYLDRNRDELQDFVERLRRQGDLPETAPAATPGSTAEEARSGRLGRLFGRS